MAPDVFLEPIYWIAGRTSHHGFLGITVGHEVFTDLDFADNFSSLVEMLEVIILTLEIVQKLAGKYHFGDIPHLEVNNNKITDIQDISNELDHTFSDNSS